MNTNPPQTQCPDVSCILPFNWSFEEYVRQCPVNVHRMQMKLFDQKLKGKVVLWCAYIVGDFANQAQLKLSPFDEQTPFNGLLRYTPQTKPKDCKAGQQIWTTAKIIKMGKTLSDLELEALPKGSPMKPDLSITYARIKEIFNPQAKELADWMYQHWANVQFSFIAKVTMLNEMLEDQNYCAMLNVEVIQPYHDNENEPVFVFLTKADLSVMPDIQQHENNPLEFTAQPLVRQNKQHWFTFIKINQVFSKEFKPQILPFNQIPSVAQEQQQLKQIKAAPSSPAGQSKWQNVDAPLQNQFGGMSIHPGMNPIPGMQNIPNQFMPQMNQGQFQQGGFVQQQQFPSPYGQANAIPQGQFNVPQQNQFINPQQNQFNPNQPNTYQPPPVLGQTGFKPPVVDIPKMPLLTPAEEAKRHYICELSNVIMTDPVSISGEHYYQRNDLVQHIQDQGLSPVDYEAATVNDIKEEPALKAEIERYLRDNPQRRNK